MYLILLISYLVTSAFGTPIVNGVEVESHELLTYASMSSLQHQMPALHDGSKHFCGGAMIHNSWILTAAHCVDGKNPEDFSVITGKKSVDEVVGGDQYNVTKVEYFRYDKYSVRNDIALLKIFPENCEAKKFKWNDETEIPYWSRYDEVCKVLGYGATEYTGKTPNPLSMAYVHLITNDECTNILGRIVGPRPENVCALGDGTDTCQGDSGGPLICSKDDEDYILGITSRGSGCGIRGVPSVYTLIHPYAEWIKRTIETK